ncbi:hypothetical protein [Porphyromonas gingivalis]|mgnify:CR=1 FL=1|uniref:Uncharacterized protein n=1 Tax=Porphyromonas gingivalis TaxID=837 RepID=A0AAE9X599_PORGN|nr:hypothetical protein [Porphyromonas gingivalis]WCF98440.1 hypothetical protein NY149_07955 [Porphyromonas gingivalis]
MGENIMYVLYADIMGFKDRVMRTQHQNLEKEFNALITDLDAWFSPNKKAQTFKVSFFSDSILVVDEDTEKGFNRISKAAAGLMQVSLEHKFPLKGVISKENFTYKEVNQLFFGRALVDAYLLQEQIHYYGIVAHHSIEGDIKKYANGWKEKDNGNRKGINPYILSPIPLKSGNITHYHLAYNLISEKRETGKNVDKTHKRIISWLEQISGTVSGNPRIYVDKTLQVLREDLSMFKEHKKKNNGEIKFPLSNE